MKSLSYKTFVLISLCLFYCVGVFSQPTNKEKLGYCLIWEDQFDDNRLNEAYWQVEVNADGGGNSEMQYYRAENISLGTEPVTGKSCLIITARKEEFGDCLYTSGRINTQGRVNFKYGKIEASIKLPKTANGLWPAFWMLGNNNPIVGWPQSGEIDIMEFGHADGIKNNTQEYYFNGACHWGPDMNGGSYPNYANHSTNAYPLQDDFHLYTLIWDENSLKMYLDLDKNPDVAPYYEMGINGFDDLNSPGHYFNSPYYILLNLAVGGHFTGITGNCNAHKITALNEDNDFTAHMYVDFVRLYQKGNIGEEYSGPENYKIINQETEKRFRIYPNPTVSEIRVEGLPDSSIITITNSQKYEIARFRNTNMCVFSDLPVGSYFMRIEDDKGYSEVHQFLKK